MAKAKAKAEQAGAGDKGHHGNYYYYTDPAESMAKDAEETDAGTLENYELLKKESESESEETENQ